MFPRLWPLLVLWQVDTEANNDMMGVKRRLERFGRRGRCRVLKAHLGGKMRKTVFHKSANRLREEIGHPPTGFIAERHVSFSLIGRLKAVRATGSRDKEGGPSGHIWL